MIKNSNSLFLTTVKPNLSKSISDDKKNSKQTKLLTYNSSQILPTLTQSFSIQPSKYTSKLKYIDSFKNILKIRDIRSHHIQPQTPISSYLSKILEKNLTPINLGLIQDKGVCGNLDLSNTFIGPQYAEALSECIKSLKIRQIQLKRNSLSDKSLSCLLSALDFKYLTELQISENSIGPHSLAKLISVLPQTSFNLQILCLENCNLTDKGILTLTTALLHFDKIKQLNVSKNKIQEEGAIAIASVIYDSECMEVLDIGWNKIRGFGGKEICKVLGGNTTLKSLNISWNSFGSPAEAQCSKALSESLMKNSSLLHLNMSFTHFSSNDCEVINTGLMHNSTLIGIDFEGNNGKIDSQGKIIVLKKKNDEDFTQTSLNMCWICGGWNEICFKLKETPDWFTETSKLKLHLHFEDFIPCQMNKANPGFSIVRMCPPGKILFYFTYDNKIVLEPSYKKVKNNLEAYPGITQVNIIENKPTPKSLWMELTPTVKPRLIFPQFSENDLKKPIKELYLDNSNSINECFEEDIIKTNLKNLTGEDYENVLIQLKPNYPAIKNTYKYLATKAWLDWEVWEKLLKKFVIKGKIFENNEKVSKELTNLIQTFRYWNSTTDIYFTRYNFLELIVRIAVIKYFHTRQVKKLYQSIKIFFRKYSECFIHRNFTEFCSEIMHSNPIEQLLTREKGTLLHIFHKYSIGNFLTFSSFKTILHFIPSEKLLKSSFIYSKEPSYLISYFDDALNFPEFLEALTRALYSLYQQKIISSNSITIKTESSDSDHLSQDSGFEEFLASSLKTIFNSI